MWEKRQYLVDLPGALPLVLLAATHWYGEHRAQLVALLRLWVKPSPLNAIHLLLPWYLAQQQRYSLLDYSPVYTINSLYVSMLITDFFEGQGSDYNPPPLLNSKWKHAMVFYVSEKTYLAFTQVYLGLFSVRTNLKNVKWLDILLKFFVGLLFRESFVVNSICAWQWAVQWVEGNLHNSFAYSSLYLQLPRRKSARDRSWTAGRPVGRRAVLHAAAANAGAASRDLRGWSSCQYVLYTTRCTANIDLIYFRLTNVKKSSSKNIRESDVYVYVIIYTVMTL